MTKGRRNGTPVAEAGERVKNGSRVGRFVALLTILLGTSRRTLGHTGRGFQTASASPGGRSGRIAPGVGGDVGRLLQ